MGMPLRVLIVEDSEDDTLLLVRKLGKEGFEVRHERVETADEMKAALDARQWDLILSDYSLPRFSGLNALEVLKQSGLDLPFIIVSGTIGEEVAVGAMRAGANDYVLKGNLKRLIPAIKRELGDAVQRRTRRQAEEESARLQEQLRESHKAEAELKASNEAKTMMLKEVHHRVKNNLMVIQSLLSLQMRNIEDERYRSSFKEAIDRVKSMTLIHERLQSSTDLRNIEAVEYIRNLCNKLFRNYCTAGIVRLSYDLEDSSIDVDTMIPLGLILNELVSNASKYAFAPEREGTLVISLKKLGGREYELAVRDNGIGLPEGFDIARPASLGLSIVTTLVKQLGGELNVSGDGGTEFRIRFKDAG